MTKSNVYIPFIQSQLPDDTMTPATPGSAAIDLTATGISKGENDIAITYHTGLRLAIPSGYAGLLLPRSSISNRNLMLANTIGLIDSDYRGEVKVKMLPIDSSKPVEWYKEKDRIAQLLIIPVIVPIYNRQTTLPPTSRGEGGFGSTNRGEKT